jgi:hypothetical protein
VLSADWKTAGDGLLTHDTVTSYNWLDVTQTKNLSYNDVESQLGPGGLFAGFHHATYDELVTFQADAGIPDIGFPSTANLVPVQNLISLVGATQSFSSAAILDSDGYYNSTLHSPPGFHDRFHLVAPYLGTMGGTNFYGNNVPFNDNYPDPRIGHWLVSGPAAAAPEPATLSIFACSMLSLPFLARCGKRRRRAS